MGAKHERIGHRPEMSGGLILTEVSPDILSKANYFAGLASEYAMEKTDGKTASRERVYNAINRRLLPSMIEAFSIAEQLQSPEYRAFVQETNEYLDARVAGVACPDGRIVLVAFGDPGVMSLHRSLQGIADIRFDNTIQDYIPANPELVGSIRSFAHRASIGKNSTIAQFLGPHIDSVSPLEGCGAAKGTLINAGRTPDLGMSHGAIKEYFGEMRDKFYAFDNAVPQDGRTLSTTWDTVHDAYTQGLIFGLKDAHLHFDPDLSLRNNLLKLAERRQILMTERLADDFQEEIETRITTKGIQLPLEITDYTKFGKNAIAIGMIAREICQEEERKGFQWIPESLRRQAKTDEALRALAYTAIRNATYMIAAGIKTNEGVKSDHWLRQHPEKLIRVGRIGADYNLRNIAFIQSIRGGILQPEDMAKLTALYDLSYGTLKHQGVDLREEARIIRLTDAFDPNRYTDPRVAQAELDSVIEVLRTNIDLVASRYEQSIRTGEAVVLGFLHRPGTRDITGIVGNEKIERSSTSYKVGAK